MRFTSSPCRRLIGLLLAVVLIVCSIPSSTVKADLSLDASFQIACVFQNNFAVSYKCKIKTPGEFSNVRLNIEFEKYAAGSSSSTWEKTTIKDYTYDSSTGEYAFTFRGISAAELGNKVKASLSADKDGQTYTSSTKSVTLKQYAMYLLNANQDNTDEVSKKLCALLVDMLNYGALTQAYFNVNAANPVNNQLTDAQQALGAGMVENPVSCYSMAALSGSTVSIKNVALVFGSTVDLAVFASFTGTPSSSVYAEVTYTGIYGEQIVHKVAAKKFVKQDDGTYRATFTGISSLYFRTPFKLVFKDGDNAISGTLTYSYESYANAVVAADVPQSIKDGVRYMLGFGDSAKKYFLAVNNPGGSGENETEIEDLEGFESLSTYKNSTYTNDMPEADIIIPANATAEEQLAAQLLSTYIAKVDGYTPSIGKDSTPQGSRFEIAVGNTNRPHGDMFSGADGAFMIKSYSNGVAILGNGKRGTIDGAAKFLALCGGYFWLSYEDGYITHQSHFKYDGNMDIEHERAFMFTDIDTCFGLTSKGENRMMSLANGINGFYVNVNVQNQPGADSWYLYHPDYANAYGGLQPGQAHTMLAEFVPPSEYFAEHPEYYALRKDKDGNYYRTEDQLCLSNPDIYPIVKQHVFDILEEGNYDPDAPMQIISLSHGDNGNICMCSDCVNFRLAHEPASKKEGLLDAALYLTLCNAISRDVKAAGYTNVYIDMLAYVKCCNPPVGIPVDDHVIIRYAAIERCYAHDCDASDCVRNGGEMYPYLKGWSELCKGDDTGLLWIWDYNANWKYTSGPYLNIGMLSHDIRHYRDLGVSGIYLQSNDAHKDTNSEFGDLRIYLSTVLLENPDADVDKEIKFFMNEFYGKSAPYILEAMEIMETQAKNHSNVGPNHAPGTSAFYYRDKVATYDAPASRLFANYYPSGMDAQNQMPEEALARCEGLWNKALKVAETDTAAHKMHTGRTHLCWRYVKSNMKVYEFADPDTYLAMNQALYDDLFGTYGNKIYSLIYRKKPAQANLGHVPDFWMSSKDINE